MKTIPEILAEANLSQDQIDQIAQIVEEARLDERAALRKIHASEIKSLVESKEAVIRGLIEDRHAELDERVMVKDKKLTAQVSADIAVGINIDQGGTLAFTVADAEGSSVAELSKPDSDAIKKWFRELKEAANRALAEARRLVKESDEDDEEEDPVESDGEVEERIRRQVYTEVANQLSERLEALAPHIRRGRAYDKLYERMTTIAEAVMPHVSLDSSAMINESRLEAENRALHHELDVALRESRKAKMAQILAEKTKDLTATTRERVEELAESVTHNTLDEFNRFIDKAIDTVRATSTRPAPTGLEEKRVVPSRMADYLSKL